MCTKPYGVASVRTSATFRLGHRDCELIAATVWHPQRTGVSVHRMDEGMCRRVCAALRGERTRGWTATRGERVFLTRVKSSSETKMCPAELGRSVGSNRGEHVFPDSERAMGPLTLGLPPQYDAARRIPSGRRESRRRERAARRAVRYDMRCGAHMLTTPPSSLHTPYDTSVRCEYSLHSQEADDAAHRLRQPLLASPAPPCCDARGLDFRQHSPHEIEAVILPGEHDDPALTRAPRRLTSLEAAHRTNGNANANGATAARG